MNGFFPGQRPDEKVLVLARAHWLALLPAIVMTVLLAVIPPIILVAIPAAGFELDGTGRALTTVLISAYYLTLTTYFFIRWLDYYLDVAIVTEDRIVDIDQNGMFRRHIDELDTKMVQDVTNKRHGILQTLFNYGNVEIQTAGERRNFVFENIPNPEHVQQLVAKSQGMGEASHIEAEAEAVGEATAEETKKKPDPAPQPKKPVDQASLDSKDLPRDYE